MYSGPLLPGLLRHKTFATSALRVCEIEVGDLGVPTLCNLGDSPHLVQVLRGHLCEKVRHQRRCATALLSHSFIPYPPLVAILSTIWAAAGRVNQKTPQTSSLGTHSLEDRDNYETSVACDACTARSLLYSDTLSNTRLSSRT